MSSALAPAQLIAHHTGASASSSRRRFAAAYKRSILRDAARCSQPGDVAALLRREGLYSLSSALTVALDLGWFKRQGRHRERGRDAP
jgi:hypothetical protein